MSRKYIDFVPAKKTVRLPEAAPTQRRRVMRRSDVGAVRKSTPEVAVQRTVVKRTMVKKSVAQAPSARATTVPANTIARAQSRSAGTDREGLSLAGSTRLGEIEDVNPKFVMTDVPKRPLGEPQNAAMKSEVSNAKAKRLVGRVGSLRSAKQREEVKTQKVVVKKSAQETSPDRYEMPKSPFINQDKVVKRPLSSKNVYTKQVVAEQTVKQSSKPVTIISKPEKESHVGVVVTIILTIIFGAVAGTVAFLLLPK